MFFKKTHSFVISSEVERSLPMLQRQYYVYIMASDSGTLYVGVTNNFLRRVLEHKSGNIEGFSKNYNCKKLVYYEWGNDVSGAIDREKQLKRWSRKKKEFLIRDMNPVWKDLTEEITG